MKTISPPQRVLWNSVALLAGVLPIVLYWFFFGRAPRVDVAEAIALLKETNTAWRLVDVRPSDPANDRGVTGAIPWPAPKPATLPPELRGKKLLLLCEVGFSSAWAAQRLVKAGITARSVQGGLVSWRDYGDGQTSALPFRPMTTLEQWAAVMVAFVIKPIYMTLSLALILWLWRQPAADLTALRWGLIWFWVGENGCSIDFLFYQRASDFWEYIHGYGMAASFSFVTYALLEGLDQRLVKFSPEKERCAALSLCRACVKYAQEPCGLKRLFTILTPALMILSLMPLSAGFNLQAYHTDILGTRHQYYHLPSSQLFELRLCAALAFLLFASSWLVLLLKKRNPVATAKILFAAAAGPLGFGLLRMFFVATFIDRLVWFDVWEELTELLFVAGTGVVLWVFRHSLFTKRSRGPAPSIGIPAPTPSATSADSTPITTARL